MNQRPPEPAIIEKKRDYTVFIYDSQVFLSYDLPEKFNKTSITMLMRGKYTKGYRGDPSAMWKDIAGDQAGKVALVAPEQKHGTVIMETSMDIALPERPKGDGVFVSKPGIAGSLRFADCFPVVMVFSDPDPKILILHSGFRGTLENISGKSIRKLKNFSDPQQFFKNCRIFIGPGIGSCCYSRNKDDQSSMIAKRRFSAKWVIEKEKKLYFDLGNIIREQLLQEGIPTSSIINIPLCTSCNNDLLYSYRRGDIEDRMFLLAGIYPDSCQNCIFWWDNIL
jgi:YfiH family protein